MNQQGRQQHAVDERRGPDSGVVGWLIRSDGPIFCGRHVEDLNLERMFSSNAY
jgi:hypothetical protein